MEQDSGTRGRGSGKGEEACKPANIARSRSKSKSRILEACSDTEPITKKDLMATLMDCFTACKVARKSDLESITELLDKHTARMDWLEDRQDRTMERVEDVENDASSSRRI